MSSATLLNFTSSKATAVEDSSNEVSLWGLQNSSVLAGPQGKRANKIALFSLP
jgi:hypothetical protein